MKSLYWYTCGTGDHDLVLLHGWGLNAEVWHCMIDRLAPHFRLHLVDLPGYGRSGSIHALTLKEMAESVIHQINAPERAIWLGWSLGGLVASQIALHYPQRTTALITLSSSPCFTAQGDAWPGIRPDVLAGFEHQLSEDYQRTVERFLALQTLGTESARQDARALKEIILQQPLPSLEVLNGGLEILRTTDLRQALCQLNTPFLRIYGALDGLVPRKIIKSLDTLWPHSTSCLLPKAAHAPFISHPDAVSQAIVEFCAQLSSHELTVTKNRSLFESER